MNPRKGLVLDANILLRAVFGIRVRQILETYEDGAAFYSPDVCFAEAKRYIPNVAKRRKLDSRLAQSILEHVSRVVEPVDKSLYEGHEKLARERIERRDARLACCSRCAASRHSRLDGRSRFLWKRRFYLDDGPCRSLSS